jgi:hypothetical protein
MNFELELVVVTRAIDKTALSPEEASSYIVGYTLAVTASVHPLGHETSEPGPGYHRELLKHPAVVVSDKTRQPSTPGAHSDLLSSLQACSQIPVLYG